MNYRIIKIIPMVVIMLGLGIPYIIYYPFHAMWIMIYLGIGMLSVKWFDYFEKKERAQHE